MRQLVTVVHPHRTEWNWISVVVIYNTTTTELWFYKRGSSGGSAREAAPLLHCCCTPPTDIHCISPPCCSVGISWRRRWRRSFHIARVAWSSSEPDVNTNGRTAMMCMLDSARWRRLQPSQRRGRGWGQRLDFLMLRQGGQRSTPKRCVYCMAGLLRWAKERESTALATSGGRKKQRCPRQKRRTSSTVLISEARSSRA